MALTDFVNIVISIDSIGIALAGFGIPMIPSANATYSERLRFYTDLPSVAADWGPTTPEYLSAQALLSQANQPLQIAIGRCVNKPTQQYTIGATLVANSTSYRIRARGPAITDTTVAITSAASAAPENIHSQLLTALNAVVGATYTATFAPLTGISKTFTAVFGTGIFTATAHGFSTGDSLQVSTSSALPTGLAAVTTYYVIRLTADTFKLATSLANALAGTALTISDNGTGTQTIASVAASTRPASPFLVTANAAGTWFSLEVLDPSGVNTSDAVAYLSNAQTHADPGIAADLIAIGNANSSWYAVHSLYNSSAYILAIAAYIETQPKIYVAGTCDSACATATSTGSADVMDTAATAKYARTSIWYHPSPIDFLTAALMGSCLPLKPGSETWAFKQLVGPRPVSLTTTHKTNIKAKNGNTYERQTSDVTWTWDGHCCDGEFIDTIRGLDKVRDDITKRIATVLVNNPKIPYTDGGALALGNELEGGFATGVSDGIFAADPKPTFVIPKVATQSSADRKARKFAGLKGSAQLAGAVHFVGPISIVVTQ